MTKRKPIAADIPKLYQRNAEDLLMYGYVIGMQTALPSVSTKKCIEMFMISFGLHEDIYSFDCAYATFMRLRKEHSVL
jgi:hypothetical protein